MVRDGRAAADRAALGKADATLLHAGWRNGEVKAVVGADVAAHVPLDKPVSLDLKRNDHLALVALEVTATSDDKLGKVCKLELEAVAAHVIDACGYGLLVPVATVFTEGGGVGVR